MWGKVNELELSVGFKTERLGDLDGEMRRC